MKDIVKIKVMYYDWEASVSLSRGKVKWLGFDPRLAVDSYFIEYKVWKPGDSNFDYTVQVTAYEQDLDYVISGLKITNDHVDNYDKEVIERLFDTIFFRGRSDEILCEDDPIEYSIEEMERVCKASA